MEETDMRAMLYVTLAVMLGLAGCATPYYYHHYHHHHHYY
jgi:hypothetical protein